MLTWTQIESAAAAAGWKRAGVEWRGPCPLCGGRDRAHVRPGSSADFIGSCRGCDIDGIALARALVGDVGEAWTAYDDPGPSRADILHRSGFTALSCPAVARPAGRPGGATTSGRLGRLWSAAEAVSGTPGAAYLESRGFSAPWPAAVRWLPADVAGDLRPRLPVCAAGAVCYRFAAADDGDTHAIQVEAVRDDGARVLFATQGKRPSVTGSRFAAGARVFVARAGGPDVALCESVIDALAVASSPWGAHAGAAVIASAGTSGMTASAVASGPGRVTIWTQSDVPGLWAAARVRLALEASGRVVRCEIAPNGMDWGDVAAEDTGERIAMREG